MFKFIRWVFIALVISNGIDARFLGSFEMDFMKAAFNKHEEKNDCAILLNFTNVDMPNIGTKFIVNSFVRELILQKNGIQSLSLGAFDGLPSLSFLDLSYNNLSAENLISFGPHPNLQVLILNNNLGNGEQVPNILHITSKLKKLKYLSLRNVLINELPSNLETYFPSLTYLDLSNNMLNIQNVFSNLPRTVTHLYMEKIQKSKIIPLPNPEALRNILYLSLNGNKVYGLGSASALYCEYLCLNLSKLEGLSLVDCGIEEIQSNSLNLGNLLYLNLSDNPFTEIPELIFQQTPKLQVFDLSATALSKLPNFSLLKYLEKLSMNNMKSNQIVEDVLKIKWNLNKLSFLSLSGNKLENIPTEMIQNLPALKELDLSNNEITVLQFNWSTGLINLQHLYLSENQIRSIDTLFLNGTASLEYLYVDRNPIFSFQPSSFKHLSNKINVMYTSVCN